MRRLAFFNEFGGSQDGSILHFTRPHGSMSEPRLIRYLRMCPVAVDVMERTPDVIDGATVNLTGSLITDGAWFWREDLAHYVSKYHVELNPEFAAHVLANRFTPVEMDDETMRGVSARVLRFWQEGS